MIRRCRIKLQNECKYTRQGLKEIGNGNKEVGRVSGGLNLCLVGSSGCGLTCYPLDNDMRSRHGVIVIDCNQLHLLYIVNVIIILVRKSNIIVIVIVI